MIKDKKNIESFLKKKFTIEDEEIDDCKILKLQKELRFEDVFCENDEDKEYIDEMGYDELFEEIGIKRTSILGFEYETIGPMSFFHSLSKMDSGEDYFYINQYVDEQKPTIIAAIHKEKYPELLNLFLRKYYKSNGTHYSEHEMFNSLPSCTEVYDKNINSDLLKECFKLFLDNISKKYDWHGSWHNERETMLNILENPGVYERSMKALDKLKDIKIKDKDSVSKYLAKIDKDKEEGLSQIDDNEKTDILKLLIYYKVRFMYEDD
tara:strand:- start:65 stop:859 length:795 start_codon:yes stop_codon:yes gene_type:complete